MPDARSSVRRVRDVDPTIVALVVLAAALRVFQLGHDSFWIDEINSVFRADGLPFLRSVRESFGPFDPPLGFAIEATARRIPGLSLEAAARLPMAVASVVEVALVWTLLRRFLHRRDEALVAAALVAIAPFAIRYGQEARYYALASALHLGGWVFVLEAARGRRRAVWWWAGVAVIAVYTTAIAWFLIGVQALIGVAFCRDQRRTWLLAGAVPVVAFLPWVAFEASYWLPEIADGTSPSLSGGLSYDVRFDPALWADLSRWLLGNGSALVAAPFAVFVVAAPVVARTGERRVAISVMAYVVVTVGLTVVLGRLSGTYFAMRRVEFLVPVLAALAAVGICGVVRRCVPNRPRLRVGLTLGLVLLLACVATPGVVDHYRSEKSDYRGAARAVDGGAFDLVVLGPLPDADHGWARAIRRYLRESGVEQPVRLLDELDAAPPAGEVAWITGERPPDPAFDVVTQNRVDRLQILAGDDSLDSFAIPVVVVSSSYDSEFELRSQATTVGAGRALIDDDDV
ncbi:MAG: glycosyltransferase family 39 protein [Acidimicrobiales bacterium]|nr:glycosyltransferase family 39 protein [Acidimicrobiales bacterium]